MSSLPWKGNNFCYLFPVLQLCNWRVQRTSTAFFSSYCSFQRRSCAFKSFRIKPVNTRQTSRLCKSVVCKRSFHKVDVLVTEKKIRKMLNKVVAQFRSDCDALLQKDSYISSLNSNWRKKDEPTDVLSFAQEDETLLGDIVISVETAYKQALERNHSLMDEIRVLLVHGFLHLLGYDHEESQQSRLEMEQLENKLLASLQWKDTSCRYCINGKQIENTFHKLLNIAYLGKML